MIPPPMTRPELFAVPSTVRSWTISPVVAFTSRTFSRQNATPTLPRPAVRIPMPPATVRMSRDSFWGLSSMMVALTMYSAPFM